MADTTLRPKPPPSSEVGNAVLVVRNMYINALRIGCATNTTVVAHKITDTQSIRLRCSILTRNFAP